MPDTLTQETADAALDPSPEAPEITGSAPADAPTESPATPQEAPDAAPATAPAEGEPAQATPTEPDASEAAPPAEDDYSAFEPFVYRAEGTQDPFPGAYQDADGRVLFTKESVPILRQALSAAKSLPRVERELTRKLNASDVTRKAAEASRDALTNKLLSLAQNPDALRAFMENFAVDVPVILAEAKARGLETQREADQQRLQEYEAERLDREQRPVLESLVDEALDVWLTGDYAVDADTRNRLRQRYTGPLFDQVFPKGEQGRQDARVQVMKADLEWWFSGRPKGSGNGQVKADQPRAPDGTFTPKPDPNAAAKAENKKRTEPVKAPPAVQAGKAAAPTGQPAKKYKSTREADAEIWS